MASSSPSSPSPKRPPKDTSSLSNPQSILVTHLSWVVHVDFETSTLIGNATYDLHRFEGESADDNSWLFLDTNHLIIDSVQSVSDDGTTATDSTYELEPAHPHLGCRLKILLSQNENSNSGVCGKVRIHYRTTKESGACQWLPPSQTAGKKHPYLFTQCQAIHARSLLPCQDQPGVKTTYHARVTVPTWATCVMSALHERDTPTQQIETQGMKHCCWNQPVPVSSYLLAMAVGHLHSLPVSPRVKIWAEPSVVEAAAYEFADTEKYLSAAEEISGRAYAWTRYDLLCLPPSFPYGGMENPCLTFVTPTLLAGDRSLADVVAHEIAHSWTGNLVTNATWEHFWLNEGWTMWLQRKICAKTGGDDRSIDFDAIGGWGDLVESVREMEEDFTKLVPTLGERDPDDAFSSVPYEKGFNLLYSLEKLVGTTDFENFFKNYIEKFAFHTVTSEQFRDYFLSQFPGAGVDWDTWFHTPGLPPSKPQFDRSLSVEAEELAKGWVDFDRRIGADRPVGLLTDWSSDRIVCFLNELRSVTEEEPLKIGTVVSLDGLYRMSESRNSEILFRYCMLAVAAEDKSILPVATRFLTSQGRMKFVRPLYRALFASRMGKKLAVDTFLQSADFYHPICAKMVAKDLTETNGGEKDEDAKGRDSRWQWLYVGGVVAALMGVLMVRASSSCRR